MEWFVKSAKGPLQMKFVAVFNWLIGKDSLLGIFWLLYIAHSFNIIFLWLFKVIYFCGRINAAATVKELSKTENKYSQTEKEALTCVLWVKKTPIISLGPSFCVTDRSQMFVPHSMKTS